MVGRDGDFIGAAIVIGGEIPGVQSEQGSAAFQVEITAELTEAIVCKVPVEFFFEFGVWRQTGVAEISQILQVAFEVDTQFHWMVSAGLR